MIHSLTISVRNHGAPQGELLVIWDRYDGDRPGFQYSVDAVFSGNDNGVLSRSTEQLAYGHDLWLAGGAQPNHVEAMKVLITFLLNDAEKYASGMRHGGGVTEDDQVHYMGDGYTFNEKTAEWAYGLSEELETARNDLGWPEGRTAQVDPAGTVRSADGTLCHDPGDDESVSGEPITIMALAYYRLGIDAETHEGGLNGQHFADAALPMMGGCEVCGATVAAYNSCPSTTGNIRCASGCIGSDGYATVQEANDALFDGELPVRARALHGNVHSDDEDR